MCIRDSFLPWLSAVENTENFESGMPPVVYFIVNPLRERLSISCWEEGRTFCRGASNKHCLCISVENLFSAIPCLKFLDGLYGIPGFSVAEAVSFALGPFRTHQHADEHSSVSRSRIVRDMNS